MDCLKKLTAENKSTQSVSVLLDISELNFTEIKAECQLNFIINVTFKNENNLILLEDECQRVVYERDTARHCEERSNPSQWLFQKTYGQLPNGKYKLYITINEYYNKKIELIEKEITIQQTANPSIDISEITLTTASSTPLITNVYPYTTQQVDYQFQFYSQTAQTLHLKYILFFKEKIKEVELARKYISVEQTNKLVSFEKGVTHLKASFDLKGLEAGEYLIQIYVSDEKGVLIETNKLFYWEWQGLHTVFENLNQSIKQLEFVANQSTINQLLSISNPETKLNQFLTFWKSQNSSPTDYPTEAMEIYYKKLYTAIEKYGY